eukprot:COSAG02_NODE_624_length_19387_cov_90.736002_20_plen_110_part_00
MRLRSGIWYGPSTHTRTQVAPGCAWPNRGLEATAASCSDRYSTGGSGERHGTDRRRRPGVQICQKGKTQYATKDGTVEGTCVDRLFGHVQTNPEEETYCGALVLSNTSA